MRNSEYLANLQLAISQSPRSLDRRYTMVRPTPVVRMQFVVALVWSLMLLVGTR